MFNSFIVLIVVRGKITVQAVEILLVIVRGFMMGIGKRNFGAVRIV